MILTSNPWYEDIYSDLHVCGDDPKLEPCLIHHLLVISTYVEMILLKKVLLKLARSDLHVCGDDPLYTFY